MRQVAADYPLLLDAEQAAEIAGRKITTIYDWSHRGLLNACKSGRGRGMRLRRDRYVEILFTKIMSCN